MRQLSIDEVVRIKSYQPSLTSRERGWNGVTVDLCRPHENCCANYPALDHHVVSYCPSGSARLIQRRAGSVHDAVVSGGISLILPAGYESSWEGNAAASARLRVPASLIACAGEQIGSRNISQIEIRNVFETRDLVIERLALILLSELEREPHPTQMLIFDQVSCALAAHLLRSYNAFEVDDGHRAPSFGPVDLARLTEFIECNIDQTITLADLAGTANVSRFHFARLFKRSTGMTAIRFVEQCRIRRAKSLILETNLPLAEVALMTGFADQSHFTRRFQRQLGCTPGAFAREYGARRSARAVSG